MSRVDRETPVPLDPNAEAGDVHNRLQSLEPALRERLGELAVTGATPAEKLSLRETRAHLSGIEQLARAAIVAIDETDIQLRESPEETLAGDAAYAAVTEFVDQAGGGFTLPQLKEHLRGLGYELPKDSKVFSRQFTDWQQRILEDKTNPAGEDVRPERRRWIKLNPRTYVLAWLEAPAAQAAPKPSPKPPSAQLSSPPLRTASTLADLPEPLTEAQAPPEAPPAPEPPRALRLVQPTQAPTEDPAAKTALRIVQEASGEPAKVLIGQLIKEMNLPAPGARHVFEALVKAGQIHRYSAEGKVRYGAEPREPQVRPSAAPAVESRSTPPVDTYTLLAAEGVLKVLAGRGVPFGKAFTPQEISRLIGGGGDPDLEDFSPDVVKAAASYLWSLGFVTRVETRGQLKLQLADRSIMTGMKSPQRRADIVTLLTAGLKYVPPQKPARRSPAKKKR